MSISLYVKPPTVTCTIQSVVYPNMAMQLVTYVAMCNLLFRHVYIYTHVYILGIALLTVCIYRVYAPIFKYYNVVMYHNVQCSILKLWGYPHCIGTIVLKFVGDRSLCSPHKPHVGSKKL